MKKYLSLLGIVILTVLVWRLGYQSLSAYLGEHNYYVWMLASGANRWILVAALVCICFPVLYWLFSTKIKLRHQTLRLWAWAAVFGLVHSMIKYNVVSFWWFITMFNTFLIFTLGMYLVCGFAAIWSRLERKLVKFEQHRWQEMLLSFGLWMVAFLIIIELLVWIDCLFWIVSWILFLGLWGMIRLERKQLWEWWDMISGILEDARDWVKAKKFWFIVLFILILLALVYYYYWIQNAFIPYSTAWDANHEYMYTPKILAENAGIYRWNSVGWNMPGLWHQFLTFIFSLTWATNWWFGLAPDTLAVSMNYLSAAFVLIFWIAIVFQIFSLIDNKKSNSAILEETKWKGKIAIKDLDNQAGITMWVSTLLLWLTSWMWAFLVIVDNKTDLWVMAFSSLALLAGLIFLWNRQEKHEKKEILKYVIIAGLFFGFAALAKITAFVDFALFGLLLIALRFSPLTTAWVWMIVMWLVRKLNVLTSSVMITDTIANWLIIIWWVITIIGLIIFLSKHEKRKSFWLAFTHLMILGISFLVPFLLFKLPRTVISQIKTDNFSATWALKSVFLSMNTSNEQKSDNKLLAQAVDDEVVMSIEEQDIIDEEVLENKPIQQTYAQCNNIWNIYSEEELNENLQEEIWNSALEDLWRYIWYWWKTFTREKNSVYWILKLLRPESNSCYGLNHDAKVLCENASVIDSFRIDDLRAIYENWINDKESEVGVLLKDAIDAYNEAKSEWKIWFWTSNSAVFHDEIVALRQYYQSHSIYSDSQSVNIPYRYIVPLNISFNWSLQNLSSYYTDIGYIWIIAYIFLLISLPYAIVKKNKILTALSLTTLIGWGIWWIIWSAILRYGTVLISWTMLTLAVWTNELFKKDKDENPEIFLRILSILLAVAFWIQIWLNFIRIASQGANSAFVWYKWSIGNEVILDDQLESKNKIKYWYWQQEIFDLQFPQYNPIIHALADRKDKDWVIVAGTYIQYFLWNQWNVKWDGMLGWFWVKSSDWDLCKTYRRLKNDNTRYLIIDPNIGTVTMWEGNESLFYRFFAKLADNNTKIDTDWTITTLIRLSQAGYLDLLSTNNMWAKYAFTLKDDEIKQYFWELTNDELILARSKMAVLQYFDEANELFWIICNIFLNRIMNDPQKWIEDIADIYGMEVDSWKVTSVAIDYLNWTFSDVADLSQNERNLLVTFLNIYSSYKQNNPNASDMIQSLVMNSVTGWSQVIALELK